MRKTGRGFTLIEVLVVVILISVLMSVVVGSYTGVDNEQVLQGFTERLTLRIEMARDRAVQTNHEWGLFLGDEQLEFAEYDPVNQEWQMRGERPFHSDPDFASMKVSAEVEAYAALPGQADNDDAPVPDIIFFSSGEVTPFELTVTPEEWEGAGWVLSSDGFSRTDLQRGERLSNR